MRHCADPLHQFHPGRSIGSMILASKYCVILATLAALTCLGAIATLATFDRFFPDEDTLGFEAGDLIVCVFWIGGSMGGLAWLKQWVNNPSFNTGKPASSAKKRHGRSLTVSMQDVQWQQSPCLLSS